MTDPALIGHLRILEAKLDRLTEAINRVADALAQQTDKPRKPKEGTND
jgi:hypothetical protein